MVANTFKENMTARDSFLDFGSDLTWEAFGNDQQKQQSQRVGLSPQVTPDKPLGKKRSSGKGKSKDSSSSIRRTSSKEKLQDETTTKKKKSSKDKDGKKKKSSSKDKVSSGKKKKKAGSGKKSIRKLLESSSSSLNFSVHSGDGNDDDGSLAERSMDESYDGSYAQRSPSRSRSPVAKSRRNIKYRPSAAATEEAADGFEVTQSAGSISLYQMRQKFKKDFPDEPVPSDLVLRQLYKTEQIAIYDLRDRFRSENKTAAMPSDDELRRMYQKPLSGEAPPPPPSTTPKKSATTPRSKVVKPKLNRDESTGENSEGGDSCADMTVMTFATEAGWEAYGKSARQVTPTPAFDAFNTTTSSAAPKSQNLFPLDVMEEGEEEEEEDENGNWEATFGSDKAGNNKTNTDADFGFPAATPASPQKNFANDELTQEDLFNSSFADDIVGSPEVDPRRRSLPSALDAFNNSFGALEVAESLGGGSLHGDMMSASSGHIGGRREGSRRGRRKVDRDVREDDRLSRSEHGPPGSSRSNSNDRSRRGRRKIDSDIRDDDYGRSKSKERSMRSRRKIDADMSDDDYDDGGMTKSRHGSTRRARRKVDADIADDDGGPRRAKSNDRSRRGRRRIDADIEEEDDDGPTRGVGRTRSAPMNGYNRSRSRDRPARSRDRMGSSTHNRRTQSGSFDDNDFSGDESGDDGAVVPATPSFDRAKVQEFASPFTPSPSIAILEDDFQAPKTPDQNPFALSSRRINPPRSDGSFGRARSKSRERPREATEKKTTSKYRKIKFVPKPKDKKSDTASRSRSVSGIPDDEQDEGPNDDGFMTSLAALDHAAADRDQSGGGWASTRPQQQQQKRQSQSSRNGWAIEGVPGAMRSANNGGIELEVGGYSENISPLTAATRKPVGRIAARRMGAPF